MYLLSSVPPLSPLLHHSPSLPASLLPLNPNPLNPICSLSSLLLERSTGEPLGVQSLLNAKASAGWRNACGHDALCCAAVGGHKPLLPLLLPFCYDRLADATVQAAAAGHARVALALAELCPFSLPPGGVSPEVRTLRASVAESCKCRISTTCSYLTLPF